jgi:hypothetical protein
VIFGLLVTKVLWSVILLCEGIIDRSLIGLFEGSATPDISWMTSPNSKQITDASIRGSLHVKNDLSAVM